MSGLVCVIDRGAVISFAPVMRCACCRKYRMEMDALITTKTAVRALFLEMLVLTRCGVEAAILVEAFVRAILANCDAAAEAAPTHTSAVLSRRRAAEKDHDSRVAATEWCVTPGQANTIPVSTAELREWAFVGECLGAFAVAVAWFGRCTIAAYWLVRVEDCACFAASRRHYRDTEDVSREVATARLRILELAWELYHPKTKTITTTTTVTTADDLPYELLSILCRLARVAEDLQDLVAARSLCKRAIDTALPLVAAGKPIAHAPMSRGLRSCEEMYGYLVGMLVSILYRLGEYREALTLGLGIRDVAIVIARAPVPAPDPEAEVRSDASSSSDPTVDLDQLHRLLKLATFQLRGYIDSKKDEEDTRDDTPPTTTVAAAAAGDPALALFVHDRCCNSPCPASSRRRRARLTGCGGCRGWVAYCGRACQKAHWPCHKPECKSILHTVAADRRRAGDVINKPGVTAWAVFAAAATPTLFLSSIITVADTPITFVADESWPRLRDKLIATVRPVLPVVLILAVTAPAPGAAAAAAAAASAGATLEKEDKREEATTSTTAKAGARERERFSDVD